jgi:hypothetical protein
MDQLFDLAADIALQSPIACTDYWHSALGKRIRIEEILRTETRELLLDSFLDGIDPRIPHSGRKGDSAEVLEGQDSEFGLGKEKKERRKKKRRKTGLREYINAYRIHELEFII